MTTEQNKLSVRRSFEEVWNQGDMAVADMLHGENVIFHDPATPGVKGLAAFKQMVTMYRTIFANIHFTLLDQIAEDDKVVTRWQITCTHVGEFMGIPPTHRQVTATGITIDRFAGGKTVETWTNWDLLGVLQQLGALDMVGA